jgi:hypothetical protein
MSDMPARRERSTDFVLLGRVFLKLGVGQPTRRMPSSSSACRKSGCSGSIGDSRPSATKTFTCAAVTGSKSAKQRSAVALAREIGDAVEGPRAALGRLLEDEARDLLRQATRRSVADGIRVERSHSVVDEPAREISLDVGQRLGVPHVGEAAAQVDGADPARLPPRAVEAAGREPVALAADLGELAHDERIGAEARERLDEGA